MKTKQTSPIVRTLPWIGAGIAVGAGALALSAFRAGLSIRGKVTASALVPLMDRRKRFRNAETLDQAIAQNRAAGPALPSAAMRRRFLIDEEDRHGMRTFAVRPKIGGAKATILYLPGGGYTFHPIAAHWTLIAGLAEQTGATIIVALFPLAPEHDWEDGFRSLTGLYRDLLDQRGEDALFIVGDSAGGGLALALAQQWQVDGLTLPNGLLLFSPFCDGTVSDPAQCELARTDHMLTIDGAREAARRWAGKLPLNDRHVSPLFGSIAGLPPMLVIAGSHDILFSDANRLQDRAGADGVDLTLHRYPGMFHVFPAVGIPEGRKALRQAGDFVRLLM